MSFAKNYHQWIIDHWQDYLKGSVAEVGAGVGSFSALLLNCDISQLTSFEPSIDMFNQLKEKLTSHPKATAIHGFFGQGDERELFDTIAYVNVLEHIEDDAQELAKVYRFLHRGGHALIFVPALRWLYGSLDKQVGHVRRYHKEQLVDLVSKSGLRPIEAHYFDIAGIIPWFINFVVLKNDIQLGAVSAYDNLIVPIARRLETIVRPPVGKNIILVAQKP